MVGRGDGRDGSDGSAVTAARELVAAVGGRFSLEAGIDVDASDHDVDRWFLAATLFGTRISAAVAVRTYRVLDAAGVATVGDAGRRTWDDLVALLDEGGYARYDFRTASRLLDLAAAVAAHHPRGIPALGRTTTDPGELVAALDALPGWGPVTVRAFLRELRGIWPGAQPPLDDRTVRAAADFGLGGRPPTVADLAQLAGRAGLDVRDLETALVRAGLRHGGGHGRSQGRSLGGRT